MSYICTSCSKLVTSPGKFCPFCGQPNIEQEVGVSNGEKIRIYVLSFVLAPLGLYWFFKFLKSDDKEKRKVGNIALIITILTLGITALMTTYTIDKYKQLYQPQLDLYKELGI